MPATVLTRMLHAVDALDWAGVRACLADEVRTDYTDLFGGAPETGTADTLVARWRALLPGFDATQHLTGPAVVDHGPVVRTHVRALHRIGNDRTWVVSGHYVVPVERTADGHRITGITLQVFAEEGDRALVELAAKRAADAPRAPR